MRVATSGFFLDHTDVENKRTLSEFSFANYDAVIVDPRPLKSVVEKNSIILRDGTSMVPFDRTHSAAKILSFFDDKKSEVQRMLQGPKVVVTFMREFWTSKVATKYWIEEPRTVSTFSWIPLAERLSFKNSEVDRIFLEDVESPFSDYLQGLAGNLRTECVLEKHHHTVNLTPLAKDGIGRVVSFEISFGTGKLVFLPFPDRASDRRKLAELLIGCIRKSIASSEEIPPPDWISGYPVPGATILEEKVEELETKIRELVEEKRRYRANLNLLLSFRKLLYEKGELQLKPAVAKSFEMLGFEISEAEFADAVLRSPEGELVLQIEAEDDGPVGLERIGSLRKQLARQPASRPLKGLVVANSYRLLPPSKRKAQFSDDLVGYAERSGISLLSTYELYKAVCKVLETRRARDRIKEALRRKIIEGSGICKLP